MCIRDRDRDSFEQFLQDNPEYIANGYDHIDIDLIGEADKLSLIHISSAKRRIPAPAASWFRKMPPQRR